MMGIKKVKDSAKDGKDKSPVTIGIIIIRIILVITLLIVALFIVAFFDAHNLQSLYIIIIPFIIISILNYFSKSENLFPHSPNGYIFGKEDGTEKRYFTEKHLLSIAPNRTGKGRGLILPNLLDNPETSVFVIDPKGENAAVSARYRQSQGHEVLIFNPYGIHAETFAARGFAQFQSFNPLANLDPHSLNFAADVTNLAEALVYETGGGGDSSHWVESARGLVEFLIMYLVTEPEEKETRTLRRLRSIIAGGHESILKILTLCEENKLDTVKDNVGRYVVLTPEVSSIIATAETQTRILKHKAICAALEGGAFDFERMKHRKTSIYLILPSEYLITQARYLRLVLLVAMSQFMHSERGRHQVLMVLDEFANLGTLKIIENGFGIIAGHGVTLWPFVQNLTQLSNLYPRNWHTFFANSAAVTASNVNDVETANYFNSRAGRRANENTSNLPVSKLYGANPDNLFLFLEGKTEPFELEKMQYDRDEPYKSRADSNPMHNNTAADDD